MGKFPEADAEITKIAGDAKPETKQAWPSAENAVQHTSDQRTRK